MRLIGSEKRADRRPPGDCLGDKVAQMLIAPPHRPTERPCAARLGEGGSCAAGVDEADVKRRLRQRCSRVHERGPLGRATRPGSNPGLIVMSETGRLCLLFASLPPARRPYDHSDFFRDRKRPLGTSFFSVDV